MITEVEVELNGLMARVKRGLIDHLLECEYEDEIYIKNKGSVRTRTVVQTDKLYTRDGDHILVGFGALLFLAKTNPFIRIKFKSINPPRKSLKEIIIPPKMKESPKWLVNGRERFYFFEALKACQINLSGFIKAPTGSGKGSMIITLAYNQRRELGTGIILVPTNAIKQQFISNGILFGVEILDYSENRSIEPDRIYVTTAITILNDLNKVDREDLLDIKWIITDEAHHTQATTWNSIFKKLPNLVRSHGFSALPVIDGTNNFTSFNKIDIKDAINISTTGPIIYEKSANDLKEFLNIPALINYKFKWEKDRFEGQYSRNWHDIRGCISLYERRKDEIARIILHVINKGYKLMMHVESRAYGEEIINKCSDPRVLGWYGGGHVFSHTGNLSVEELREKFGTEYLALIGTSHLIEGLDLDNPLNFLVLTLGKNVRQIIQKSGRIVRPDDQRSIILNFCDEGIWILPRQAEERSEAIISEFMCESHQVNSFQSFTTLLDTI